MAGDWKETPLAAVMEVKHGFAFPGENIRDEPPGDILLTPGNFAVGGGFKGDKFKYFDGEVPPEYILNENDLIVTMTDLSRQADTLGFPALVPRPRGPRFLHNQRLGKIVLKPGAEIDKKFLFYLLRTQQYRHEVLASATGTTVKHTSPGRILAHKASLPPLAEQKAIATVLGVLDDKIELNHRMNATLEAKARALFQSWFVDFDPVRAKRDGHQPGGLDPTVIAPFPGSFQDSDLGRIPQGWTVQTIGEIIELSYGRPLKAEDRQTGLYRVYGSNGPVGWHNEKLVSGPGIVVGRKGNPGVVTWAHGDFYPIDTTFYVETKSECRSLYFLFYALSDQNFANLSSDSAVPGLNRNHAYMSKQVIPPTPVLEIFDRQVAPIFATIHANEAQSRILATIRDALLPKLLSGKIRLSA